MGSRAVFLSLQIFFHIQINYILRTIFLCIVASCRGNDTAMSMCGDGNSCLGSAESYICVCNTPGYKLNESDVRECIKGISNFYFYIEL